MMVFKNKPRERSFDSNLKLRVCREKYCLKYCLYLYITKKNNNVLTRIKMILTIFYKQNKCILTAS